MARHNKKKVNKNRKKLKGLTLIFLTMLLILELTMLDTKLRKSTSTDEMSIYSLSFNDNTLDLELFGNEHQISRADIRNILENLKVRVKGLKD